MSNNTTAVTGTASADPFDDPVTSNKMAIRALIPLLITFVLGTLCLQGFNLVFQQVGAHLGPPKHPSQKNPNNSKLKRQRGVKKR